MIPKGNPIPFLLNYESAAREAFEEAGVEGGIAPEPIGSYRYEKRRRGGEARGDRQRLSAAGDARGAATGRSASERDAALVRAGRGRRGGRGSPSSK